MESTGRQTVLIANDHPEELHVLERLLTSEGYHVLAVGQPGEIIDLAVTHSPDVVILGLDTDNQAALMLCEQFRLTAATQDVPVILQTSRYCEVDKIVEGLSRGAFDYLIKPYHEREFIARVGVMARISSILKRERQLAITDELTGLLNRRYIMQRLREELNRAARNSAPLSCLMMDLDHFKVVNDTFGHLTGDRVLRQTARITSECKRVSDVVGRYGGEEFLMLLPETGQKGAMILAERIRNQIEKTAFSDEGKVIRITASVGVATCAHSDGGNPEEIIRTADNALYMAKHRGRNCIIHHDYKVAV